MNLIFRNIKKDKNTRIIIQFLQAKISICIKVKVNEWVCATRAGCDGGARGARAARLAERRRGRFARVRGDGLYSATESAESEQDLQ